MLQHSLNPEAGWTEATSLFLRSVVFNCCLLQINCHRERSLPMPRECQGFAKALVTLDVCVPPLLKGISADILWLSPLLRYGPTSPRLSAVGQELQEPSKSVHQAPDRWTCSVERRNQDALMKEGAYVDCSFHYLPSTPSECVNLLSIRFS